jgi:hypothetical protein
MTAVLNGILRAVRQPTAAKMATGFELGKLLIQNELQRSVCQPRPIRPNVLDRIGGTAICRNALIVNEKRLAASHCDEPSMA